MSFNLVLRRGTLGRAAGGAYLPGLRAILNSLFFLAVIATVLATPLIGRITAEFAAVDTFAFTKPDDLVAPLARHAFGAGFDPVCHARTLQTPVTHVNKNLDMLEI